LADKSSFKQSEFQAASFAVRTEQADVQLDDLERYISGLSVQDFVTQSKLPNFMKSPEFQKFEQTKRNFINAKLREESGAVISDEEFDDADKQYMPQPGDSPEVLAQKKANRNTVIQGLKVEAGGAYNELRDSIPNNVKRLEPLNQSFQSLEDLVSDRPDYIDLIEELDSKFPSASDDEILGLIEQAGSLNNDLGKSIKGSSDISNVVNKFRANVVGSIDPSNKLVNLQLGDREVQINQSIASKLAAADREYFAKIGKHIPVNQSFRTPEKQRELFRKLSARGAQVAPQGFSFHEVGMAIDVGNAWREVRPFLQKQGFRNDLPNDRGHFSIGEFA